MAKIQEDMINGCLRARFNAEWTPVTEAVPDGDGYVLVSFGGKDVLAIGYYYRGVWRNNFEDIFCIPVKAWRPLPPDYIEDN